jgi:uncharacterized membrane protein
MNKLLYILTFLSALGCGLTSGTFFAFSAFVMKGLGRLPAAQGIAAMQSINIAVISPSFMVVFLGTAGTCLFLLLSSVMRWSSPGSLYLLAGSLLYLAGSTFVTMACNVPRNDALAAIDATGTQGSMFWMQYLRSWTAWNHVRAVTTLTALASFTVALIKTKFE